MNVYLGFGKLYIVLCFLFSKAQLNFLENCFVICSWFWLQEVKKLLLQCSWGEKIRQGWEPVRKVYFPTFPIAACFKGGGGSALLYQPRCRPAAGASSTAVLAGREQHAEHGRARVAASCLCCPPAASPRAPWGCVQLLGNSRPLQQSSLDPKCSSFPFLSPGLSHTSAQQSGSGTDLRKIKNIS